MVVRERPQQRRHLVFALRVDVGARLHQPLHLGKIVRLDGTAQRDHLWIGEVILRLPAVSLVYRRAGQHGHQATPQAEEQANANGSLKRAHRFASTLVSEVCVITEHVDRDPAKTVLLHKQSVQDTRHQMQIVHQVERCKWNRIAPGQLCVVRTITL